MALRLAYQPVGHVSYFCSKFICPHSCQQCSVRPVFSQPQFSPNSWPAATESDEKKRYLRRFGAPIFAVEWCRCLPLSVRMRMRQSGRIRVPSESSGELPIYGRPHHQHRSLLTTSQLLLANTGAFMVEVFAVTGASVAWRA